jgi:hypothetical protein
MAEAIASPARRTLEAHLETVRFLAGIEDGRWSVLRLEWPNLYVRVTGRDLETGQTLTHDSRLECEAYPDPGPFVERWAFADEPSFGSRPPAPSEGSPGFIDAKKNWGVGGIYRAWQRTAAGHGDWARKRPDLAWHRQREIVFIMEQLYDLLSEQAVWLASRPR